MKRALEEQPLENQEGAPEGRHSEEVLRFDRHLRTIAVLFYTVGIAILLLVANTNFYVGMEAASIDDAAINVVAGLGSLILAATLVLPWARLGSEAFFAVPTVSTLLISVCVYYSGGWESFPYALYAFAAVFCALYFRPRLAALGVAINVVAGASPILYQPDLDALLSYLFVRAPVFVTLAWISGYMVRQVVLRDRALRASEAELMSAQNEADLDGLTGVSNRRHLQRRLEKEFEVGTNEVGTNEGGFTLLFADIDDFKQVNDLHGHAVGDDVLRFVASSLTSYARKTDLVARYGGEEFVVLMSGASTENARALFERVREGIVSSSEERFGFQIRMSAGAVSSRDFPGADSLIKSVDEAMYEAKRLGKDQIFIPGGPGAKAV